MTTFSFYSFKFKKFSPYKNFKNFFGIILAPPSGRRAGQLPPPLAPLATQMMCCRAQARQTQQNSGRGWGGLQKGIAKV